MMELQKTYHDQLVTLFTDWYEFVDIFATEDGNTELALANEEEDFQWKVSRQHMHKLYSCREQLRVCPTKLTDEVESNLMAIIREQHSITYLSQLARTHNEIKLYLSTELGGRLMYLENNDWIIEPPMDAIAELKEGLPLERSFFLKQTDPYFKEFFLEEWGIFEDKPPIFFRLIKQIAEQFNSIANTLYSIITKSLDYKLHPELIQLTASELSNQDNTSTETTPLNNNQKLTAVQKLLFIRLLQMEDLFPSKPINTDNAPELKAIALLTGVSYENQLKGVTGANAKVDFLLNYTDNITAKQAVQKLMDLDVVEQIAKLLNVHKVIYRIDEYRQVLKQIIANRIN